MIEFQVSRAMDIDAEQPTNQPEPDAPPAPGPLDYTASLELQQDVSQALDSALERFVDNGDDVPRLFQESFDLLDLSIEIVRREIADETATMRLIHDLVDFLIIDYAEPLVDFFNSRLSAINGILRRASKSKHSVLCGKVLTLITFSFPLDEKSGTNIRGQFNTREMASITAADAMDVDPSDGTAPANQGPADVERAKLYTQFWAVQEYFSNPKLLFDAECFSKLKKCIDSILRCFEEINNEGDSGESTDGSKRRKPRSSDLSDIRTDYFFPTFLTSQNLFDLELKDPLFRRQILVQVLITLQFLAGLYPDEKERVLKDITSKNLQFNKLVLYSYSLTQAQEAWIKESRDRVYLALEKIPPRGKQSFRAVYEVLTNERNWIRWKQESCPSYERPAVPFEQALKRRKAEVSLATNPASLGNDELTSLWARGSDLDEVLRFKAKRSCVPALDQQLRELDYQVEDDGETLAEGVEDAAYVHYNNLRYNWLTFRIAVKSHMQLFLSRPPADAAQKESNSTSKQLVMDLLRDWRQARRKAASAEESGATATSADPTADPGKADAASAAAKDAAEPPSTDSAAEDVAMSEANEMPVDTAETSASAVQDESGGGETHDAAETPELSATAQPSEADAPEAPAEDASMQTVEMSASDAVVTDSHQTQSVPNDVSVQGSANPIEAAVTPPQVQDVPAAVNNTIDPAQESGMPQKRPTPPPPGPSERDAGTTEPVPKKTRLVRNWS
nr:hypothetical protein HK105_005558 [Polyrhizophydium stewartii]